MENSQPNISNKLQNRVFFQLQAILSYKIWLLIFIASIAQQGFAQLPSLSYTGYNGPKTYTVGTTISSLTTSNSGGIIIPTGLTNPFAGSSGYPGNLNGTQGTAQFNGPNGIAEDASGNIYVADQVNNMIRKITSGGVVTTLAGNTTSGSSNGTGTAASFFHPTGVAVDGSGNVYVADQANNMIRKITSAGVVTTLAGTTTSGSSNGTGTSASFNAPNALIVDGSGNVYVTDYNNNMVRKITSAGVVTTFAGSTTSGSSNGTGTAAKFSHPMFIAMDGSGNFYVTDRTNNMIRKLTSSAVVTTLAGNTIAGSADGTGIAASFNSPSGIAVYGSGNIFVADEGNDAVRMITPGGVVTTYASHTLANVSTFGDLFGIAVNASGTIFVADHQNDVITKITPVYYTLTPTNSSSLPNGLNLNRSNGTISGMPADAKAQTNYTITAYSAAGPGTVTLSIATSVLNAYDKNGFGFVQQERIMVDTITTDAQIYGLPVTKKQTTRSYYDGFGRTIQSIGVKASPLQNDIIQPVVYDNIGRQTKSYLSYSGQSSDTIGEYRSNALTAQHNFYNNTSQYVIAKDTSPYTQQVFENSPLQRLLQSGMVGVGFQPVSGQHFKTVVYRYNQSGDGNILIWNPDATFTSGNYYGINSLSVIIGTDEDGIKTTTFTDLSGHLILKRQMVMGNTRDTYYLYNAAGMLSYILPPAAVSKLAANSYDLTTAVIANQLFHFTYDTQGRTVTKKVPVKGTMCIVYDPFSRPLLMQNANMAGSNRWNYIKYDVKGRVTSQGLYTDATHIGQQAMQTYINGLGLTSNYESRSSSSSQGYYTNNAFPTTGTPLAYCYYDDYDLDQDASHTPDFSYTSQGLTGEDSATTAPIKGAPTIVRLNTITNNAATNNWLIKVMFYDKRGNTIQVQSNNQINTGEAITDYSTMVPDFTGAPLITKVSKKNSTHNHPVQTNYTYDHMHRVTNLTQKYTMSTPYQIAAYTYNELGQLIQKGLGGTTGGSPIQNINFRYNIRGQLLNINNSTLANDAGKTCSDNNDLFGMQMLYDQVDGNLGNTAFFDGKASAVKWMSRNAHNTKTFERSYKYNYDNMNRYIGETYAERDTTAGPATLFNVHAGAYDENNISYDGNGNITGLTRNTLNTSTGANTVIDNLTYSYSSTSPDLLTGISDIGNQQGFNNITGASGAYGYDANGNLTSDPYKGINLSYNFLNKTDKISVVNTTGGAPVIGQYINYTYDASGKMIRKQVTGGGATSTLDYVDGFVFSGTTTDSLDYFPMPEGRVLANPVAPEFIITDQQGNARISFKDNGSGVAVVTQENSYYGFGLIMPNSAVATPTVDNKQLYNGGSEWQNDYQNLPDYYQTFNRNYDAAIGRFVGVDPVAESAESMTSYQYAGNNPIMYNDPLGDKLASGGFSVGGHFYNGNGQEVFRPSQGLPPPELAGPLLPGVGPNQAGWMASDEAFGTGGLYGSDPYAAWNAGLAGGTHVFTSNGDNIKNMGIFIDGSTVTVANEISNTAMVNGYGETKGGIEYDNNIYQIRDNSGGTTATTLASKDVVNYSYGALDVKTTFFGGGVTGKEGSLTTKNVTTSNFVYSGADHSFKIGKFSLGVGTKGFGDGVEFSIGWGNTTNTYGISNEGLESSSTTNNNGVISGWASEFTSHWDTKDWGVMLSSFRNYAPEIEEDAREMMEYAH